MHYYYNSEIDEKMILLDSKNGKDLGGNILRIAQELSNNELYAEYDLYISCNKNKFKELKRTLATYKIDRAHIVKESGFKHFQLLAKSKFIFTDTSFPFEFVKKEGQIITNTWHGTPLKKMGRDIDGQAHTMSNVQKSFIISDYLLFPSDYMKNIMIKAYCLDNLYKGKILSSGYPRNSIFFYPEKGEELRNRLGFGKKHVYAYMPTWRGTVSSVQSDEQILQVKQYLDELDKKFNEDEVLLVRLHPFVSNSIELNNYHHIQPFPNGFEPYDILNMVDCLITDYSSVFFDFANSRKKIVLFVYDKDLYLDDRGIYVQMETFPFPQVYNVTDLLVAIRSEKEYDDSEFRDTYCKYDRADSAKIVCHQIILGKQILVEESVEHNGKDNVLMCGGPLAKNGLTTAFLNLLESIDNTKRNYFVLFVRNEIRRNPSRLNMLPEWASIMVMNGFSGKTPLEYAATFLYFKKDKMSKWIMKYVDRFFDRQYKSFLGECDFDYAIHYSGYGLQLINLFQNAQCKNIIFVHNDMIKEIETRHIQHEPTIRRASNTFYRVVPVTTDIYIPTIKLGQNEKNIMIDSEHPLLVYIPCGVGGAPGGVAYGLKRIFKENAYIFFVEPTLAPCMVLGMESGLHEQISVRDIGINGITHADGLAVARPSGLVGRMMDSILSGEFTVEDYKLYDYLRCLNESENIRIEPSSCAAFEGPVSLLKYEETKNYIEQKIGKNIENAYHICWATGGRMVPKEDMEKFLETHLK